jgi:predicted transcriptional regulator
MASDKKRKEEAKFKRTVRERIQIALKDKPDGLSKARLVDVVNVDRGHFRNILNAMVAAGEVSIIEEQREGMPSKICRLLKT